MQRDVEYRSCESPISDTARKLAFKYAVNDLDGNGDCRGLNAQAELPLIAEDRVELMRRCGHQKSVAKSVL